MTSGEPLKQSDRRETCSHFILWQATSVDEYSVWHHLNKYYRNMKNIKNEPDSPHFVLSM